MLFNKWAANISHTNHEKSIPLNVNNPLVEAKGAKKNKSFYSPRKDFQPISPSKVCHDPFIMNIIEGRFMTAGEAVATLTAEMRRLTHEADILEASLLVLRKQEKENMDEILLLLESKQASPASKIALRKRVGADKDIWNVANPVEEKHTRNEINAKLETPSKTPQRKRASMINFSVLKSWGTRKTVEGKKRLAQRHSHSSPGTNRTSSQFNAIRAVSMKPEELDERLRDLRRIMNVNSLTKEETKRDLKGINQKMRLYRGIRATMKASIEKLGLKVTGGGCNLPRSLALGNVLLSQPHQQMKDLKREVVEVIFHGDNPESCRDSRSSTPPQRHRKIRKESKTPVDSPIVSPLDTPKGTPILTGERKIENRKFEGKSKEVLSTVLSKPPKLSPLIALSPPISSPGDNIILPSNSLGENASKPFKSLSSPGNRSSLFFTKRIDLVKRLGQFRLFPPQGSDILSNHGSRKRTQNQPKRRHSMMAVKRRSRRSRESFEYPLAGLYRRPLSSTRHIIQMGDTKFIENNRILITLLENHAKTFPYYRRERSCIFPKKPQNTPPPRKISATSTPRSRGKDVPQRKPSMETPTSRNYSTIAFNSSRPPTTPRRKNSDIFTPRSVNSDGKPPLPRSVTPQGLNLFNETPVRTRGYSTTNTITEDPDYLQGFEMNSNRRDYSPPSISSPVSRQRSSEQKTFFGNQMEEKSIKEEVMEKERSSTEMHEDSKERRGMQGIRSDSDMYMDSMRTSAPLSEETPLDLARRVIANVANRTNLSGTSHLELRKFLNSQHEMAEDKKNAPTFFLRPVSSEKEISVSIAVFPNTFIIRHFDWFEYTTFMEEGDPVVRSNHSCVVTTTIRPTENPISVLEITKQNLPYEEFMKAVHAKVKAFSGSKVNKDC
mmetsp:Transcript_24593/g.36867  ORF Transcript_24593/g.36867 Transcript_24593/m.36867 type:complete len:893 (-) Transcript_24593:153-2831(-)